MGNSKGLSSRSLCQRRLTLPPLAIRIDGKLPLDGRGRMSWNTQSDNSRNSEGNDRPHPVT